MWYKVLVMAVTVTPDIVLVPQGGITGRGGRRDEREKIQNRLHLHLSTLDMLE